MITVVLEGKIHRFNGPDAGQQAQELCRKHRVAERKRPVVEKDPNGPKQPYQSSEKRVESILAGLPNYGSKGESIEQIALRIGVSVATVKKILQGLQHSGQVTSHRIGALKHFTLPKQGGVQ